MVMLNVKDASENVKLIIICDSNKQDLIDEDGNIVINIRGTEKFCAAPLSNEYITEQVDKNLDNIRDFIIEGLTNCYVEYDENGKEVFISKTK